MDVSEKMTALARAVLSTAVVHFAPDGVNPICSDDMGTGECSPDPGRVEGCIDCLMQAVSAKPPRFRVQTASKPSDEKQPPQNAS